MIWSCKQCIVFTVCHIRNTWAPRDSAPQTQQTSEEANRQQQTAGNRLRPPTRTRVKERPGAREVAAPGALAKTPRVDLLLLTQRQWSSHRASCHLRLPLLGYLAPMRFGQSAWCIWASGLGNLSGGPLFSQARGLCSTPAPEAAF